MLAAPDRIVPLVRGLDLVPRVNAELQVQVPVDDVTIISRICFLPSSEMSVSSWSAYDRR